MILIGFLGVIVFRARRLAWRGKGWEWGLSRLCSFRLGVVVSVGFLLGFGVIIGF